MLKRVLTVLIGVLCLLLATVGLYRYGWTKWTTLDSARFPDTLVCRRNYYPTFGGSCSVPSDVAYGLLLTTAALLVLALIGAVGRLRRRNNRRAHIATPPVAG